MTDPNSSPDATRATLLLNAAAGGDRAAASELLPLVYQQLRAMAQQRMDGERADHTLQATALVHEAYARLVGNGEVQWSGKAHFYTAAAEAMRRILIEHARARARIKRGGDGARPPRQIPLNVVEMASREDPEEIVRFDDALRRLEEEDPDAAAVVRLRFFAGLDIEQTAAALGTSVSTVNREWAWARAWLHRSLHSG